MKYEEVRRRYEDALGFYKISSGKNFKLLKALINEKKVSFINIITLKHYISLLAGIKDVFDYMEQEISRIDEYRKEIEKKVKERKR